MTPKELYNARLRAEKELARLKPAQPGGFLHPVQVLDTYEKEVARGLRSTARYIADKKDAEIRLYDELVEGIPE